MKFSTKRVAITTLFGAVIFVSKAFLPTPFDKMFIIIQAVLLGLGSLMLKRMGATYVATVGGFLTALSRPVFFPFTLFFALLYGFFVDILFFTFKVNTNQEIARTEKLVASLSLSTCLTGLLSYHVSVLFELTSKKLCFRS